jgi:UDP-2-acetamido-2-deoxy-ribo-hexuluronate aminotransferase
MLNIILDNDVVIELLSKSQNDIQYCFSRSQKSFVRVWLPCCSLSWLETQIQISRCHPVSFLLNQGVQWLTSLSAHWAEIPPTCPNKTQAMISLDAATLPGTTVIWTNSSSFTSLHPSIEWGDHEFIYSMLAQYETQPDLVDLVNQQLRLRPKLEKGLFKVLQHGRFVSNEAVLERELANYIGAKHCITLASGTDALLIALLTVGVKPGREVIISPFNSIATARIITLLGAKPVFVDIDPHTYTLDPTLLANAITEKTRTIVANNLYGQCADFAAINAIAKQRQLPIIEDASSSFGATHRNFKSGNLATISYTNFAPNHPLSTYGSGGACFTQSEMLANRMRQLSGQSQQTMEASSIIGINSQLDTFQAGILLAKLTIFPQELAERLKVADRYHQLLKSSQERIKLPTVMAVNQSVYAQYTIEIDHRDQVQQDMQQQGIPTTVIYPVPLHLHSALAMLKHGVGSFPVAERVAQQVLSLPIHPYLTEEMQIKIVKILKSVL